MKQNFSKIVNIKKKKKLIYLLLSNEIQKWTGAFKQITSREKKLYYSDNVDNREAWKYQTVDNYIFCRITEH